MYPGVLQQPGRAVRKGGSEDQNVEDSLNGLPPMTGGRNTFRGGVQDKDYRNGVFLQGEAAGSGTVHGVQVGDGDRVSGGPNV